MRLHTGPLSRSARLLLGLALLAAALPFSPAVYGQSRCSQELRVAEAHYRDGSLEEAVDRITLCLEAQGIDASETVAAYRLLALVHLRSADLGAARIAIVKLLSRSPGYEPDPVLDPPEYTSLVTAVKEQLQGPLVWTGGAPEEGDEKRSWFEARRTWLTVGGGLLAVGIATLLTRGEGGDGSGGLPPLSGPPPLP